MKKSQLAIFTFILLTGTWSFAQVDDKQNQDKQLKELEEKIKKLEETQQKQKEFFDKIFGEKQDTLKHVDTLFDEGFYFVGADDRLRIGASAQLDTRFFEHGSEGDNTFLIRRARFFATGVLEDKFGYMVMPRWDNGAATLHFAWLESTHLPYAKFRVGQFKEPLSLEGLHSDQYWDFLERSLIVSTQLPLEDIGFMVYGKCWEDRIEYGLGWFNGRGKNLTDNNDDKDFAGRLVLTPFKTMSEKTLQNLNIGFSYSVGDNQESIGGTTFKTGSGITFWTFGAGTTEDDNRIRRGYDVEWIYNSASIKAEFLEQDWGELVKGAAREDLSVKGWFIQGSYILTGDEKRRNKPVVPKDKFDPAKGKWGAFEVVGRYEKFDADRGIITSAIATGTNEIKGWTLGLNWYTNRHMKIGLNYQHLNYKDKLIINGKTHQDEDLLTLRVQFEM